MVLNESLRRSALRAALPLSLAAASLLLQRAHQPQRLKPALALTVAATLLHGVGMAAGFALVALQH